MSKLFYTGVLAATLVSTPEDTKKVEVDGTAPIEHQYSDCGQPCPDDDIRFFIENRHVNKDGLPIGEDLDTGVGKIFVQSRKDT